MVPLVATVQELELVRRRVARWPPRRRRSTGVEPDVKVGTMIELPRAALTAGDIAEAAEFFSFGTNDLTQMTWGFSRDDVEASFFSAYLDKGVFGVSPVRVPRHRGVGALVRTPSSRAARPARTCTSASAASTAATRTRSTSSTRSGWTTCPARRSGCRSPGWRPAGSAPDRRTPPERLQEVERVELVDRDDPDARGAAR